MRLIPRVGSVWCDKRSAMSPQNRIVVSEIEDGYDVKLKFEDGRGSAIGYSLAGFIDTHQPVYPHLDNYQCSICSQVECDCWVLPESGTKWREKHGGEAWVVSRTQNDTVYLRVAGARTEASVPLDEFLRDYKRVRLKKKDPAMTETRVKVEIPPHTFDELATRFDDIVNTPEQRFRKAHSHEGDSIIGTRWRHVASDNVSAVVGTDRDGVWMKRTSGLGDVFSLSWVSMLNSWEPELHEGQRKLMGSGNSAPFPTVDVKLDPSLKPGEWYVGAGTFGWGNIEKMLHEPYNPRPAPIIVSHKQKELAERLLVTPLDLPPTYPHHITQAGIDEATKRIHDRMKALDEAEARAPLPSPEYDRYGHHVGMTAEMKRDQDEAIARATFKKDTTRHEISAANREAREKAMASAASTLAETRKFTSGGMTCGGFGWMDQRVRRNGR